MNSPNRFQSVLCIAHQEKEFMWYHKRLNVPLV